MADGVTSVEEDPLVMDAAEAVVPTGEALHHRAVFEGAGGPPTTIPDEILRHRPAAEVAIVAMARTGAATTAPPTSRPGTPDTRTVTAAGLLSGPTTATTAAMTGTWTTANDPDTRYAYEEMSLPLFIPLVVV